MSNNIKLLANSYASAINSTSDADFKENMDRVKRIILDPNFHISNKNNNNNPIINNHKYVTSNFQCSHGNNQSPSSPTWCGVSYNHAGNVGGPIG
jgi:hypothetical protein